MKNALYSMMIVGLMVFAAGAMLFVACDSPDKLGEGGGGGGGGGIGGTVVIDVDAAMGKGGGGGGTGVQPTGDANCGSVTSSANHLPADVVLVLDRSGSMNESMSETCYCNAASATRDIPACADTTNCTTRWAALTTAVNATLGATTGSITWGLKLYSSTGEGCTLSTGVEVPVAASSVAAIQSRISSTAPGGNTPTAQAVEAATAYLKTLSDPNNKVILLATDGEPNCRPGGSSGSTNVPGTVTAIGNARTAGFPVYVIGIGTEIGNLDEFAQAGGTGKYYPATSPEALAQAFAAIGQTVTTCTFALNLQAGADVNNVAVYLDKNLVEKNATNGWSFGPNNQTVVLNGSSCEKVKTGAASNVQILVGCDYPPPKIP